MSGVISKLKDFATDDSGATSIEYALIAAIISIAIVAGLTSVKDALNPAFGLVGGELGAAIN